MKTSTQSLLDYFLKSSGVCTDTRKIKKDCIFFALKGPNFNGNLFAQQAIEAGAQWAVVDEIAFSNHPQCLLVEDGLKALQDLAHEYRMQLNIPIIAITGSNGKTTTKELTQAVLSKKYHCFATQGNLNNHIGVPLSLLSLTQETEIAVIEMGANHLDELALLCEIAAPTCGLITNVGLDHLEGYGSLEGVAKGNSELFYYLLQHQGLAFVHAQDELLMRMAQRLSQKMTYGTENAEVIGQLKAGSKHITFIASHGNEVPTHLMGSYNLPNILASLTIGKHFDVAEDLALEAIAAYQPSNHRSQLIQTEKNEIIMDAYNANPSSMMSAIDSLVAMQLSNSWMFLGDMFEMGSHEAEQHLALIKYVQAHATGHAVFCGPAFAEQSKAFAGINKFHFFVSLNEAETWLVEHPISGATILIKGSRGMAMEKLLPFL